MPSSRIRSHRRVPFISIVKHIYLHDIGEKTMLECESVTRNLSIGGICIETNIMCNPGTKIYMYISVDGRSHYARGVVVWSRMTSPRDMHPVNISMGIMFEDVDEELLDICHKMLEVFA